MKHGARGAASERSRGRWWRFGFVLLGAGGGLFHVAASGQEPDRTAGGGALARRVDAVLAAPSYRKGHWGILVVDRKTGQVMYERNADQLFALRRLPSSSVRRRRSSTWGPDTAFRLPLSGMARWTAGAGFRES